MNHSASHFFPFLVLFTSCLFSRTTAGTEPAFGFQRDEQRLEVLNHGQRIASYVFADEQLPRPYFAHVTTLSGKPVTRNHPPREGFDRLDHANMHPGIWLSFGDLNGNDYWRLKSKTQHVRFLVQPEIDSGVGKFTVLNHYLTADGLDVVCEERCAVSVRPLDVGYSIGLVSEFVARQAPLRFGDQEEMGLGIRVATPLAVESGLGGRILDSEGRRNGSLVWGKPARWCDYAGPVDGSWIGMTIFTSPKNFRTCWSHARDYGFIAMNPFGLNAFTGQPRDDVIIQPGSSLKLAFAVVVHESTDEGRYDVRAVYERLAAEE